MHFDFLPQRGILTPVYLPTAKHLPPDAMLRAYGCQFLAVAPLATQYQNLQVRPAFQAWALVGTDSLAGTFGFQVQIWHNGVSGQRQLFSISLSSQAVCGSAGYPQFLTEPELFLENDSIRVQVKNLSRTDNDSIWIALWGGDVVVPA